MNDVPLVKDNKVNDINTSLIAIKKQLKELNAMLGLIDTSVDAPDMSPYVKKDDVTDTVQKLNFNPVTSNAVANSLSYSTNEVKTGGVWVNGKPIYRLFIQGTITSINTWTQIADLSSRNIHIIVSMSGIIVEQTNNYWIDLGNYGSGFHYNLPSAGKLSLLSGWVGNFSAIIEYTKTTD